MSLVQLSYYDIYELDNMGFYEIDEKIINELNIFIKFGVSESNICRILSKYAEENGNSREEACCRFIEKNYERAKFSAEFKSSLR